MSSLGFISALTSGSLAGAGLSLWQTKGAAVALAYMQAGFMACF